MNMLNFKLNSTGQLIRDRKKLILFLKAGKLLLTNKRVIAEKFKEFVTKENIFSFLDFCKLFNLKLFKKYLVSAFENNFVGFSKSLGFQNIDYKTLKFFVSRSTIHVSSEIEVFEAIVNWVEHDKNARIKYMCNLLKMVRLPLLSSYVIRKLIRSNKFCQSCPQCCDHINEVLSVKENPNKSSTIDLQHRCCIDKFTHFEFPSHFASLNSENGLKD